MFRKLIPNLVLFTDAGLAALSAFKAALLALQVKFPAPEAYLSQDSQQLLQAFIDLLEEVIAHNNMRYWTMAEPKLRLEKFFTIFSDNLDNFSPECYDDLSCEIAKAYLSTLDGVNPTEHIANVRLFSSLITGMSGLSEQLAFVQANTRYAIRLYELCNRQKKVPITPGQTVDILTHALVLIKFVERKRHDFTHTANAAVSASYSALFPDKSMRELQLLNAHDVLEQYNAGVRADIDAFKQVFSTSLIFCGLERMLHEPHPFTRLGRNAGNSFANLRSHYLMQSDIKDWLVDEQTLAAALLRCGEPRALNGFSQEIAISYDATKAHARLTELYDLGQSIRTQLKEYLKPRGLKHHEKVLLATRLNTALSNLFNRIGAPLSITGYLAQLLSSVFHANKQHQELVRTESLSYGRLGVIMTNAVDRLSALVDTYDYTCDPKLFNELSVYLPNGSGVLLDYPVVSGASITWESPVASAGLVGSLDYISSRSTIEPMMEKLSIKERTIKYMI